MKRERAELVVTLIGTLAVLALLLLARAAGYLQPLELIAYDVMVALRSDLYREPTGVAVVAVTDSDLAGGPPVPAGGTGEAPPNACIGAGGRLSDAALADLVEAVEAAGARTIGIDIYRDQPSAPGTERLAVLLAEHDNVVGISKLPSESVPCGVGAHPVLAEGRNGFSDLPLDPDRVVRRALLVTVDPAGATRLSFALTMALAALGQGLSGAPDDPSTIMIGETPLPRFRGDDGGYSGADDQGYQALLDFRPPRDAIPVVTMREALAGEGAALKGRVVVIGTFSDVAKDNFAIPLTRLGGGPFKGAVVHAEIVDELIRLAAGEARPTRVFGIWWERLLVALACLLAMLAAIASESWPRLIVLGFGGLAALALAGIGAFLGDWWLPVLPVLLGWAAAFTLATASMRLVTHRRQRQLTALFAAHLSPEIADQIWLQRSDLLSGGKPRPVQLFVTALFLDLVGSSKAALAMDVRDFVDWIDRCIERMAEIIIAHGGFIEEYAGDGLMAVFGAPLESRTPAEQERDALAAARCALALRDALPSLNDKVPAVPAYRLRIGLHSGIVYAGTVGHSGRLQYSVLGDPINAAARLESFGRAHMTETGAACVVSVSEETAGLLGPGWATEPAGVLTREDGKARINVLRLLGKRSDEGASG